MSNIDVFSGGADGLCGLHQFRLTYRIDSTLLTGVKRDLRLLDRVEANSSDVVSVFNVPVGTNREALFRLLGLGVQCICFDGHFKGIVGKHPGLTLLVDQAAETCGEHIEDLHVHPAEIYRMMKPYGDPLRLLVQEPAILTHLRRGRESDLRKAREIDAKMSGAGGDIYVLPEGAWCRRIRGDYANHLALKEPDRAHAVLTHNRTEDYTVSVRAPVTRPRGADRLCEQFEDGGGRPATGGINALPGKQLAEFTSRFFAQFQQLGR